MNTKQAYKIIDAGWAKKRKGYRVRCQHQVDAEMITDYFPDMDDGPWLSEVAIWRMAWRLAKSKKSDSPDISAGDLVNIYVVEEGGKSGKILCHQSI